ncbi:hypothetical protein FACS1894189_3300 [Planctomycetales bacterium]|nr:hypothetical protein FACS1894189_3300 [Planctomycetales bacterium]
MRKKIIGIILVFAVFAGLGGGGWYLMKTPITANPLYQLSPDKITVTPPPPWVADHFVNEVLQSSDLLAHVSMFDKTLPQKLAQAFAVYPWVERVEKVELRYPSGAEVRLTYRSPAALVEIPSRGHYPVDCNGILLPTDYFISVAPEKQANYPLIQGVRSVPLGAVGTPWGDPIVHDAAQLAKTLDDISIPLKLTRILPVQESAPTGSRIICRLKTAGGTEIIWGRYSADDPKNETKKKRLLEMSEQYRSLDNVPAKFQPIDLTNE